MTEEFFLLQGGAIGYWQGDARKLLDDVAALRPTLFAAVPRVLERVYAGGWGQGRVTCSMELRTSLLHRLPGLYTLHTTR